MCKHMESVQEYLFHSLNQLPVLRGLHYTASCAQLHLNTFTQPFDSPIKKKSPRCWLMRAGFVPLVLLVWLCVRLMINCDGLFGWEDSMEDIQPQVCVCGVCFYWHPWAVCIHKLRWGAHTCSWQREPNSLIVDTLFIWVVYWCGHRNALNACASAEDD